MAMYSTCECAQVSMCAHFNAPLIHAASAAKEILYASTNTCTQTHLLYQHLLFAAKSAFSKTFKHPVVS